MARQYEEYRKEFDTIKKDVQTHLAEVTKYNQFVAQTSGIIQEGVKELGRAVQKVKDRGVTGSELKDFLSDKEVADIHASIQGYMSGLEKELTRAKNLYEGPVAKTLDRFRKLSKEVREDIAARKKQVSTKLHLGNKSLPDLERLLSDMALYTDQTFGRLEGFEPDTVQMHRDDLAQRTKEELAKTKTVALSEFQRMMSEQAVNTRNLAKNLNRAKKVAQDFKAAVADAAKAAAAGDSLTLADAKIAASKAYGELDDLTEKYEKALQDQWVSRQIDGSKDKGTIQSAIAEMVKLRNQGRDTLKQLANVSAQKK